jgi:hypothetical protein
MSLAPTVIRKLQKIASATADDRQVETSFADMVSVAVANKAGPLLQNGRHIGFEIIKKNDENTHMLGVSVFRLGTSGKDDLVYAPAIFSQGKLTCTELLYRVGPKKFVPFKPDWCQFLMDMSSRAQGKPHDKMVTNQTLMANNWHMLSTPPSGAVKMAGTTITEAAFVDEMLEAMSKRAYVAPVLRDFINQAGLPAVEILRNTIEVRPKLAQSLYELGTDTWMPPELLERLELEGRNKAAAAAEQAKRDATPTLWMFTGGPDAELLKSANVQLTESDLQTFFKQGYVLKEPLNTPVPEHKTVAYEGDFNNSFVSPGQPGKGKMLLAGGKLVDVVVGEALDIWGLQPDNANFPHCPPTRDGARHPRRVAVALDSPAYYEGEQPLTMAPGIEDGLSNVGQSISDIETPGLFALLDPAKGRVSPPVWIAKAEKKDGITTLWLSQYPESNCQTVLFNPDLDTPVSAGVLGGEWRAQRLKFEKVTAGDTGVGTPCCSGSGGSNVRTPNWSMRKLYPATAEDFSRQLREENSTIKEATMRHTDGVFELDLGGKQIAETRHGMAAKLASLLLEPSIIEDMLDKTASTSANSRFVLNFSKSAGALQVLDSPVWQTRFDNIHMKPMESPQAFTLRTYKTPVFQPVQRLGDVLPMLSGGPARPAPPDRELHQVPEDLILNGAPEQIQAYAQGVGAPHVFDHAVLGSLARTYDSAALLAGFIPKLEDGVDYLGRSLFLFNWRPEDWRNLYGVDDLTEIGQKLRSVFDNMGDVVLDLLKKTRTASAT